MARSSHHSLAEHYRAHREAFTLALELGCTPKEAAIELQRREALAHLQETQARMRAKLAAPAPMALSVDRAGHDPYELTREPWWMD